jgi:hypothetical protein
MTDQDSKPPMKWRVVMINTPHDRLERHPDYQYYCEERILGEYATEEEAIEGARKKMVQMGQFQGWADDEESDYYQEGPPYSTYDADPYDVMDEDEHTTIEVEEIKKEEVKKKPETKKK